MMAHSLEAKLVPIKRPLVPIEREHLNVCCLLPPSEVPARTGSSPRRRCVKDQH
jgi:hypothetical protein